MSRKGAPKGVHAPPESIEWILRAYAVWVAMGDEPVNPKELSKLIAMECHSTIPDITLIMIAMEELGLIRYSKDTTTWLAICNPEARTP